MKDAVCPECKGTGVVPDSIDNYVYDPWGMAPCPVCNKPDSVAEPSPPPEPAPPSERSVATAALEKAVARGAIDEAARQLEAGADANALTYERPETGAPWIAAPVLGLAVERGDAPMVTLLLAHGARSDAHVRELKTPTYDPYGEDVEVPTDTVMERADAKGDPAVLAALRGR